MFKRLAPVAFLCVCATALEGQEFNTDANTPVLGEIQLSGRADQEYTGLLNLLIEVGNRSDAQDLLELDSIQEVRLRIEGPAQFYYRSSLAEEPSYTKSVSYRSRTVRLPEISAGSDLDSRLFVEVEGSPLWDPIVINHVPEGFIEAYWMKLDSAKELVLRVGAERRYVLADLSRIDWEKVETDSEEVGPLPVQQLSLPDEMLGGDCDPFELGPTGPEDCEDFHCPPSVWAQAVLGYAFQKQFCASLILPWGAIEMVSGSVIPGYSFKPESADNQVLPVTTVVTYPVDGLYRDAWGCGKALKIPNNSSAEVALVSAGCCQGLIAFLSNQKCVFIDPGPLTDWKDCPA